MIRLYLLFLFVSIEVYITGQTLVNISYTSGTFNHEEMDIMDEIQTLLLDLGYESSEVAFRDEPNQSKKEILELEQQFGIDTEKIIRGTYELISQLPSDLIKKWISLYDSFNFFGGKDNEINSNQREFYIVNKKATDSVTGSVAFSL